MTVFPKWRFGFLAVFVMLFAWQASAETANNGQKAEESAEAGSEASGKNLLTKHTRGKRCVMCHTEVTKHTFVGKHGNDCNSCHVTTAQSLPGAEAQEALIKRPNSADCVSCHKNDRKLMNWAFNVHNKAGGVCGDCHSHVIPGTKGLSLSSVRTDTNSAACVKCHQDVNSQFKMRSHHPVQEGAMSCTGCHDPHGGSHTALKTKTDQCLACHQSIRGPKVFEHAPVVEDCTNCHAAHGSPNRNLLSTSQPSVCLQCHSVAQGKHGFGTEKGPGKSSGTITISGSVLRGCTNCHGAIHGSHQDPLLRY